MCGDEFIGSVIKEAKRNPQIQHLDRLAEMLPPKRMTYWPYLIAIYEVSG
jgi:hypothetical protein